MTKITNLSTVLDAKNYLRNNFDKGCKCPTCGQNVKLYKRKLNSGMILFLIGLYRLTIKTPGRIYFQNKEIMSEMNINTSSLDYSVLRHFKLIKESENKDNKKRNSGYWMLLDLGFQFVKNNIEIPTHVLIYNNTFQGYSDSKSTITKSLGEKFNYQELIEL